MTVTEKVRETATELKEDLVDAVEHLKAEVAQLKGKVGHLVPFRGKETGVPVRQEGGIMSGSRRWPMLFDDPWFTGGWPQVDFTEGDDEIRVRAELPGVEEDDIDVSLSGKTLTIRGEKRSESEDRGRDEYRHECYYGSFQRVIPLPCDVEGDRVEAKFRKGVLTVTLPKTREAREHARRIPVRRA